MARNVKQPRIVPRSWVMIEKVVVDEVSDRKLAAIKKEFFPFPDGIVLVGHRVLGKTEGQYQVMLVALSLEQAEKWEKEDARGPHGFHGLVYLEAPEAPPVWLKKPKPSRLPRLVHSVMGLVFLLTGYLYHSTQTMKIRWQEKGAERNIAQQTGHFKTTSHFMDGLIQRWPSSAKIIQIDFDTLKKKLTIRARCSTYANVAEVVQALSTWGDLGAVRSPHARILQDQGQRWVEFDVDAALL